VLSTAGITDHVGGCAPAVVDSCVIKMDSSSFVKLFWSTTLAGISRGKGLIVMWEFTLSIRVDQGQPE
jgi:hypothetical protein